MGFCVASRREQEFRSSTDALAGTLSTLRPLEVFDVDKSALEMGEKCGSLEETYPYVKHLKLSCRY